MQLVIRQVLTNYMRCRCKINQLMTKQQKASSFIHLSFWNLAIHRVTSILFLLTPYLVPLRVLCLGPCLRRDLTIRVRHSKTTMAWGPRRWPSPLWLLMSSSNVWLGRGLVLKIRLKWGRSGVYGLWPSTEPRQNKRRRSRSLIGRQVDITPDEKRCLTGEQRSEQ